MNVVSIIQAENYGKLEKLINEEIEFKDDDGYELDSVEKLSDGQTITVLLVFDKLPHIKDFGESDE